MKKFACRECKRSMVVNGFMFPLLGLYDIFKIIGNKDAEFLFL
jgi:hypothetical protein